jgi:uncharacterized membrane protein
MFAIYLLLSIALTYLHFAAVTLALGRRLPYAIARGVGVVLPLMALFFLEHFIGLGKIAWIWPFSTAACAALVYLHRDEALSRRFLGGEAVFACAFGVGLLWKCLLPDIHPSSERITDLYFIANYFDGARLPPLDHWYAGHTFNFYYAFQHYGAALMGRWFGLPLTLTYNLAFIWLMALGMTLAWDFIARFVAGWPARLVLILALTVGGTGVSPLLELFVAAPANVPAVNVALERMWGNARFIGNYDAHINTEFGRALLPPFDPAKKPTPEFEPLELPMENYGYHYFVGDYHPPLGGFFVLFLMLALLGWSEQLRPGEEKLTAQRQTAQGFLLALCGPLMLITNTWVLPMQALLLASWAGLEYWRNKTLPWRALLAGGALGFMLIYPFLSGFAMQALNTPIRFVGFPNHTDPVRFLVQMWPLLGLFGLLLFEVRKRPLVAVCLIAFVLMLLAGEFLWVDDPSGGRFERTNTTMKWWGWMWSGALLSAGALAMGSRARWVRLVAFVLVCGPAWYLVPTLEYMWHTPKDGFARLDGMNWFTRDRPIGAAVAFLRDAPAGIVLENHQGDAFDNQTVYALYGGKPSLQGWPNHVSLWHNGAPEVWLMKQQIIDFYKGTLPDPLGWLLQNKVQYVVWGHNERILPEWQKVNDAISGRYDWKPFLDTPNDRVGVWVLR